MVCAANGQCRAGAGVGPDDSRFIGGVGFSRQQGVHRDRGGVGEQGGEHKGLHALSLQGADHAQRQVGRGHDAVGADGQGRAVLGAGVGDLLAQNVGDIQPLHRDRAFHFHRAGGRCFCRFRFGGRLLAYNITGLGNIVALPIAAGDGRAHLQTGELRFAVGRIANGHIAAASGVDCHLAFNGNISVCFRSNIAVFVRERSTTADSGTTSTDYVTVVINFGNATGCIDGGRTILVAADDDTVSGAIVFSFGVRTATDTGSTSATLSVLNSDITLNGNITEGGIAAANASAI